MNHPDPLALLVPPYVRVRPRWGRLAMVLGIEALLLVVASIAAYSAWLQHRLERDGRVGLAEVVTLARRRAGRVDVLYRLRVDGVEHWREGLFGDRARWASIPRGEYDAVRSGGHVWVRYLPDSPGVSDVASARRGESPPMQVAIALWLVALALPIGVVAARQRARREAALRGRADLPMWIAERGPRAF